MIGEELPTSTDHPALGARPEAVRSPEPSVTTMAVAPLERRRRRRFWQRLSIQSQLLLMLLVVSVASALIVGVVGYVSGRDALRRAAFRELIEVREARARELERLFRATLDSLAIYSRGASATVALEDFTRGFAEFAGQQPTPEQADALEAHYDDVFLPRLIANTGGQYDPAGFLPDELGARLLQALYTAPYDELEGALAVEDAGDGSAWSTAHAAHHDFFREIVERFDYDDLLLIDTEGNIVYTTYKGVDLGTNLRTGPYRDSSLADAYEAAVTSNTIDFTTVTDFEPYQPNYGQPVSWAASPVGADGDIVGVLALQLPVRAINDVMTGNEEWSVDGLGETGEVYLAGPDRLMRSVSRELLENSDQFARDAADAGVPADTIDDILRTGDTILLQPVPTEAVDRALRNEEGTVIADGYLGREVLAAYAPLRVADLPWVIVAKMDRDEALAPVSDFTRTMALATALIIVVVCLASLLCAQTFVRPVRRLQAGVQRVAAGDLDAQVDAHSNEEFGNLANAFNDMSRSLRSKAELLEEQQQENDRLLLTLMPESVARRYREGEQTIAEDHRDVSVIFADLVGFEDFSADLPSDEGLALLNGLVANFDDAAQQLGVDKVRVLRNGYLASSGLITPHLDSARRAVELAVAMDAAVDRFNARRGASVRLRAGIDTGKVTSGLVGPSNVVFDMWGDTVNLAHRARATNGRPGIFVTGAVYDRVRDLYRFEPAGTLETSTGPRSIWRLETES